MSDVTEEPENQEARGCYEGYTFRFTDTLDASFVMVEAPTIAAIFDLHPDLRDWLLEEVWCHGCANRIWADDSLSGGPWEDEWVEGETSEKYLNVVRHEPVAKAVPPAK